LSGPQGEIAQTALREATAASGRSGIEIIKAAQDLVRQNAQQYSDIAATLRYFSTHAGRVNDEIAALKNEMAAHARQLASLPMHGAP